MELSSSLWPRAQPMEPRNSEATGQLFPRHVSAAKQPTFDVPKPYIGETVGIRPVRHSKLVKPSWVSLWSTVAFVVGISFVFFSLCGRIGRIHSGTAARQLAGSDGGEEGNSGGNPLFDDESWVPLDADELAVLCTQVGEWTPSAAPRTPASLPIPISEADSASNEHVSRHIWEGMLMSSYLSGASSNGQQPRAAGSTQHKGKRTSEGGPDGWGPSPKKFGSLAYAGAVETSAVNESTVVQQPAENVQQTAGPVSDDVIRYGLPPVITAMLQHGVASSMVDLQGAQQMQLVERPVSQQSPTTLPDIFSAPSTIGATPFVEAFGGTAQAVVSHIVLDPAIDGGSIASVDPSPQRSDEASQQSGASRTLVVPEAPRRQHPFVRMPALMSSVRIEDIEENIPEPWLSDESTVFLHKIVRHLSLKPVLDLSEASELMSAVITLARRALLSMTTPVDNVKASVAVEALGRRFLVFNTFYTILKLMGERKPHLWELWHALITSIPTAYGRPPRRMSNEKHKFQHNLSQQLSAALESYKNGSSPSEEEVLDIKRKLFCMPFSPPCFLRQCWDMWRHDDKGFPDTV